MAEDEEDVKLANPKDEQFLLTVIKRPETETQPDIRTSPFEPDEANSSPPMRHTRPKAIIRSTISSTSCAPVYQPTQVFEKHFEARFAHLNCFQFTPYGRFELPPTLTILKQHVKAVCLLLHLLQPSPVGKGPNSWPEEVFKPPFEWLQDLERPYAPKGVPAAEWDVGLTRLCNKIWPGMPNTEDRSTAELIRDANIVLTTLHFTIQPKHSSLLSLNLGSHKKHPVLAEWISFTRELRNRVATFKGEVRFLTETIISEADVPTAQCKELRRANAPESYSLEYPTDRYVLAGLSEGLWNRLTEELKGKERDELWDRKEELAARQGAPKFDLVDDSDDDDDDKPRVTWIETTSRLYIIKGMEQHIFVIPGFGAEHGNMTLHREQEDWLPGGHERAMERLYEDITELTREESELRQDIENEERKQGMLCWTYFARGRKCGSKGVDIFERGRC